MNATLYRALLLLAAPVLIAYTLLRALRGGGMRYLRERLGFPAPNNADVWLHAASVGEVNAALPLLTLLRERHPHLRLLVTTATATGAATVARRLPEAAHAYLPIDWPSAVRRFFTRVRPRCALVIETELWPNLFRAARERAVPLVIVNGRLSARTLAAPAWVRRLYALALRDACAVLARSTADAAGFVALGADAARVTVIGNLKFAGGSGATLDAIALPRPYLLAASTREGEERLLLDAWRQAQTGGRLLVIAPRHPERRDEILRELGGQAAVRSRGDEITERTEIYLADTLGELQRLMVNAELVYIGGSLVPRGGQNLLEPARLGKAILFGPHMENFADEARLFLENDGALQVADVETLSGTITALLADSDRRTQLGKKARQLVEERADMAERYLTALAPLCPVLGGTSPAASAAGAGTRP